MRENTVDFAGKMHALTTGKKTRALCNKKISNHSQKRLLVEINAVYHIFFYKFILICCLPGK